MPDTPYDIGALLRDIQATAEAALTEAQGSRVETREVKQELRTLNGSVGRLTQYVEGTEADRDAGLLAKTRDLRTRMFKLEGARDESVAVLRVGRWMIATSIGAVAALIAVLTLALRLAGAL